MVGIIANLAPGWKQSMSRSSMDWCNGFQDIYRHRNVAIVTEESRMRMQKCSVLSTECNATMDAHMQL